MATARDDLRARFISALDAAHHTHLCPVTGRPRWTGCVHPDGKVGSCHSERRADAVLAVRDEELERLRTRVAQLEREAMEMREREAASHDDLAAAIGRPSSMVWPDLVRHAGELRRLADDAR
ncbi:hypothetical protein AB0F24_17565 [Streptomyces platensis]|uniref:hypothetical protein n=1 Tax=Streptomyces platensis TaxID=58346 RepID=UPI0033C4DB95